MQNGKLDAQRQIWMQNAKSGCMDLTAGLMVEVGKVRTLSQARFFPSFSVVSQQRESLMT